MAACSNPECTFPACGDPEMSVDFCCEKCEGRFNGEEWALSSKAKKHTAYCTGSGNASAYEEAAPAMKMGGMGAWGGGGAGKGWGKAKAAKPVPQKCQHPECEYLVHSDPSWIAGYCCEKCQGLCESEDPSEYEGGKRHYKNCEKRTKEDAMWGGGGGGKADAWGGADPWGGAGPYGGFSPAMMKAMMGGKMGGKGMDPWSIMAGKMGGKGADPWGMEGGKGKDMGAMGGYGGKAAAMGGYGGKGTQNVSAAVAFGKSTGKAAGKPAQSLDNFADECKLWVGSIPAGTSGGKLVSFFKEHGAFPKWAEVSRSGDGTGGVAFATEEQALEGIMAVSGLEFDNVVLELGAWADRAV